MRDVVILPIVFIDSSRSVFHSRLVIAPNCSRSTMRLSRSRGQPVSTTSIIRAGTRRHDADPVGQHRRLVERMRDQEYRRAGLAPQAQHFVAHQQPRLLVERAERLVEQDEPRLRHQRARDADALPHAAGKLRRIARPRIRASPIIAIAASTRRALLLRVERRVAQAEGDVVAHRQPGKARIFLEHDADAVRNLVADAAVLRTRSWPSVDRQQARRSARAASTCRSPTGRRRRKTRPAGSRGRSGRARARPGRRRWRGRLWSPRAA